MSEAARGSKNHFYGKTHDAKSRKKMSEKASGQNNTMYGKNTH